MRRGISFIILCFFFLVIIRWGFESFSFVHPDSEALRPENAVLDFNFFSSKTHASALSQGYGITRFSQSHYPSGRHNGVDIAAPLGTPVRSATGGVVLEVGNQDDFCPGRGYGKYVLVRTSDASRVLLYAHLDRIAVESGAKIVNGDTLARVGVSGFGTAPHLHFSVFEGKTFRMENKEGCGLTPVGRDINPVLYLESLRRLEKQEFLRR